MQRILPIKEYRPSPFGPGSIKQAHTSDEFIEVAELERGVQFFRNFLLSFSPMSEAVTKSAISPTRVEDFPEWYQQVVRAADLAESSEVRGCMVIKPWGFGIWEISRSNSMQCSKRPDIATPISRSSSRSATWKKRPST